MNRILWLTSLLGLNILNGIAPSADISKKIAEKFEEQDGMEQEDPITLIPFSQTVSKSKEPFLLMAIPTGHPIGSNYSFYDAKEVRHWWTTFQKSPYKDPLTNLQIKSVFIFRYNPASNDKKFPFDFVEELAQNDLVLSAFDTWLNEIRKKTADWAIEQLLRNFRVPTLEDLKQVYVILETPVDDDLINSIHKTAIGRANWFKKRSLKDPGRHYTDHQLKRFLTKIGFPIDDPEKLKAHYEYRTNETLTLSNEGENRFLTERI